MITLGELMDRSTLGSTAIARSCGVSYNAVYKWKKGLRKPKPKYIKKLSKILNVETSVLLVIVYGDQGAGKD